MTEYIFPLNNGGEFHLDSNAVSKFLVSPEMVSVMQETADKLARELGRRGVDRVWIDRYGRSRAAAAVTVPGHTTGAEMITGLLADAARSIGLEVNLR